MSGKALQGVIFTSEKRGDDKTGDGSSSKPFKTVLHAMKSFPTLYVDGKDPDSYEIISKSQLKKVQQLLTHEAINMEGLSAREEGKKNREQKLEEAMKVKIVQDLSLAAAKHIRIYQSSDHRGVRVKINGWVHHLRRQSRTLMFVTLRDGDGFLLCVLSNQLCQTYEAVLLSTESSVTFYGTLKIVPDPGGHDELNVDYWELVGFSRPGVAELLNEDAHPDVQLDNRYMMIRMETKSKILKVCSVVTQAFRSYYFDNGYTEVTPPTLVPTQVQGGSTSFKIDSNYFSEEVFMSQSSQLFLETCIPALGNVFCIAQSYRAEPSRTRRHLAEYTLIEGELSFISFKDLLNSIEDLICDTVDRLLKSPLAHLVYELNPNFVPPKRPFKRMDYSDAIEWLKANNVTKDDGTFYEFGEDIPEATERKMADIICEPIMLCRFPAGIKAFYVAKCPENRRLTESVDVLLPRVGEIAGGSMREIDYETLIAAYHRKGIDPEPYYWYTDQRVYGTTPHGGYRLRMERFLCWLLNRDHMRLACIRDSSRDVELRLLME